MRDSEPLQSATTDLKLTLLGSSCTIRSSYPRWIEAIRIFWAPFEVDQDVRGPTIRVDRSQGDWILVAEDTDGRLDMATWITRSARPWDLLHTLRYVIVDYARKGMTGHIPIHAAAVVREGRAMLLPGPNEAGKSTLARLLLERGWEYMSDDLAPVSIASAKVRPFPKPLGVREPSEWMPLLSRWTPPQWLGDPTGAFLLPASAYDYSTEGEVPVDLVIFPRFRRDPREWFQVFSAAEAIASVSGLSAGVDAGSLSVLRRLSLSATKRGILHYNSSAAAMQILERDVLYDGL